MLAVPRKEPPVHQQELAAAGAFSAVKDGPEVLVRQRRLWLSAVAAVPF